MSSMSAKDWSRTYRDLINARCIESRSQRSVTGQLVVRPSSDRLDYLGLLSRREPGKSRESYLSSWPPRLGSTRSQKTCEDNVARQRGKTTTPARKFNRGDIVIPHPSRVDLVTVGQGIVLFEDNDAAVHADFYLNEQQYLYVYFAAKDVDLYTESRKFARAIAEDSTFIPPSISILNTDLQIVKEATGWLDPPSIEEAQMTRFTDIGEEL